MPDCQIAQYLIQSIMQLFGYLASFTLNYKLGMLTIFSNKCQVIRKSHIIDRIRNLQETVDLDKLRPFNWKVSSLLLEAAYPYHGCRMFEVGQDLREQFAPIYQRFCCVFCAQVVYQAFQDVRVCCYEGVFDDLQAGLVYDKYLSIFPQIDDPHIFIIHHTAQLYFPKSCQDISKTEQTIPHLFSHTGLQYQQNPQFGANSFMLSQKHRRTLRYLQWNVIFRKIIKTATNRTAILYLFPSMWMQGLTELTTQQGRQRVGRSFVDE